MNPNDALKFEVRDSPINGRGLYAKVLIKKGEAATVWHPKLLTKQEAENLPPNELKHYTYTEDDVVIWMQPPEKFMNHSCDPNTHVINRSDVALRDIAPGEELTSDYLDFTDKNVFCNCGSVNCKRPMSSNIAR